MQWYKDGKFPVDKLVKLYPAGDLDRALDDLNAGRVSRCSGFLVISCILTVAAGHKARLVVGSALIIIL